MDAQYFIDKFEAIPEEKWCVKDMHNKKGQSCANGHCGIQGIRTPFGNVIVITPESKALAEVFLKLDIPIPRSYRCEDQTEYALKAAVVNNGDCKEYQQATPKQRILAALRDIQALEGTEGAIKLTKQILEDGNRNNSDNEMQLQSRLSGSDIRKGDESTQRKHKRSSLLHRVLSFL